MLRPPAGRVSLYINDNQAVTKWMHECAPEDEIQLKTLFRYQYLTKAMVYIYKQKYFKAISLLSQLISYFEEYKRVIDLISAQILISIALYRLQDSSWKISFANALELVYEYRFVRIFASFGVSVQPLIPECEWDKDEEFLKELAELCSIQAVQYSQFLLPNNTLEVSLTYTEKKVISLICKNISNEEISKILNISLNTVKTHNRHVFAKLGAKNRAEVKRKAKILNLI